MTADATVPTDADPEELLRVGAAARLLGMTDRGLRRAAFEGRITSVRTPGGHNRFRRADVLAARNRPPGERPT